uniref:Uncharacterized protein n=1 Tax=Mycena chlorophos TaxID=658473 RepID=A0ABQ0LF37_MYCCL|nr:predicted protein [Mycena chlorophos]
MVISFKFTFGATQVHGRFIPYTVQYLSSHVAVCNDRQSTLGTHVVGDSGLTQKGSLAFYQERVSLLLRWRSGAQPRWRSPVSLFLSPATTSRRSRALFCIDVDYKRQHFKAAFRLQWALPLRNRNVAHSRRGGSWLSPSHVLYECINTVFFGLALYSICRKPAKSATTFVILVVVVCLLCLRNHTGFARPFRRDHVARGQKYGSERRITCVEAPPLDAHFGSLIVIKILGRSSALAVSLLVESLAGSIYCAFWLTQVVLSSLPPTTTVSTALARWAIKSPGSIRH